MKSWILALALFALSLAAQAAPQDSVDIFEFTIEALSLDNEYQGDLISKKISDVRKEASDNLFRGRLELSPYIERNDLEPSSYFANSYKEEGTRLGYTQFLPLGTQLNFGVDKAWENTRSTSLARENTYTIGLVQPLWRNAFGQGERLGRAAFALEAEALEARSRASRNEACSRAANTYVDAWTEERRAQFVNEVSGLAGELFRKGEPAFRAGQIAKLDWWGVQSEHLNLQDQKSQAEQRLLQQRLSMSRAAPMSRSRSLRDPAEAFQSTLNNLKREQKKEATHDEHYLEKLSEARRKSARAQQSLTDPQLDFKVTQYLSDGLNVTEDYQNKNLVVSLDLVWQLNDASVRAPARIAELESERALILSRQIKRTREDRFRDYIQTLVSQASQIQTEKKRVQLLGQITDENKRRFLQGRLEFQDFLRVKEQWFETQNRLLEKQAGYFKNLAAFALTENFPVPFCQEKP